MESRNERRGHASEPLPLAGSTFWFLNPLRDTAPLLMGRLWNPPSQLGGFPRRGPCTELIPRALQGAWGPSGRKPPSVLQTSPLPCSFLWALRLELQLREPPVHSLSEPSPQLTPASAEQWGLGCARARTPM